MVKLPEFQRQYKPPSDLELMNAEAEQTAKAKPHPAPPFNRAAAEAERYDFSSLALTLDQWADLKIPPPVQVLGAVFTTTTRAMLSARTGIGKTNLGFAIGYAMAGGEDFCHWRGYEPARVLLVDGEMSSELMQERLADAERRLGVRPKCIYAVCNEQAEAMLPLDTKEGQAWLDALIDHVGGVDFAIFDNVMSLTQGDLKEPEDWKPVTAWAKTLTARHIGFLWIAHTGYDGSHTYGDSTREWQMDTVMIAEGDDATDRLLFTLRFTKARRRKPDNRADFEPVTLTLIDDEWSATAGPKGGSKRKMPEHSTVARETLEEAIKAMGQPHPPVGPFPPGVKVVHLETWRTYFYRRVPLDCPDDAEPAEVKNATERRRKRFERARNALEEAKAVGCIDGYYWTV